MAKHKVFMVDDHAALRDGLAVLINQTKKFEVKAVASNGREAMEKLENGLAVDIVLLDLTMPEIDGYTVADWLAANRPAVKILVMTMGADREKLTQLLAAGVSGILNKDATRKELEEALETVISGGQYYSNDVTREIASVYRREEISNAEAKKMNLSEKELQFIRLAVTEMTYIEISHAMGISKHATEALRVAVFDKLEMKTRVQLAMYALKKGLVNF